MPAIEQAFGRDVRSAIWRAADVLRAENEFLGSQLPAELPAELSVHVAKLVPEALQRRMISAWLKEHGVSKVGLREVDAVRSLMTHSCAKVNLPGGLHARRRAGKLFLERLPPALRSIRAKHRLPH